MRKSNLRKILFRKKLYKFLIDDENKKLILALMDILLCVFYLNLIHNFFLMIVFYLFSSIIIRKYYLKFVDKVFKKQKQSSI